MNPSSESGDFKRHRHKAATAQPGRELSTVSPEANRLGLWSARRGRWLCTWQGRCALFKTIKKRL